jgi:cysteine desulfurase
MPDPRKALYLDTMASTPVDPRVATAMAPFWSEAFGNPHSNDHEFGWRANAAVTAAATRVARLIGADLDEIIFTSGATEANNLAILGLAHRAPRDRRRVLVSAVEHKCTLAAARAAEERYGIICEQFAVDHKGRIDLDDLAAKLSDDVLCVAAMAVNNEIGTVQDVGAIAGLAARSGAVLVCDAVQAPLAMDIDVGKHPIGALVLSAHKLYGPKGIGALYLLRDLQEAVEPLIYGGGQQNGLRSGTLPTPLCVGLGAAAEIAGLEERHAERARLAAMRDEFEIAVGSLDRSISFNGRGARRHPANSSVRFGTRDGKHLLSMMQPHLAASTGSACTSGTIEPSHVLRAIGLSEDQASASVRFSFGRFNSYSDVGEAVRIIGTAIALDRAA